MRIRIKYFLLIWTSVLLFCPCIFSQNAELYIEGDTEFSSDTYESRLEFSSDGRLLISGGTVWSLQQDRELYTFSGYGDRSKLSSDSRILAFYGGFGFGEDDAVNLLDIETGQIIQKITGITSPTVKDEEGNEVSEQITDVIFSPDGKVLAIRVGTLYDQVNKIVLWDIENRRSLYSLQNKGNIGSLTFNYDGSFLIFTTSSGDTPSDFKQLVRVWDIKNGKEIGPLNFCSLKGQSEGFFEGFTHHGKFAAISKRADGAVNKLVLCDRLTNQKHEFVEPQNKKDFPFKRYLVKSAGKRIVWLVNNLVTIWEIDTRQLVNTITEDAQIWDIAISRDGKQLATNSADKVTVWNIEAGTAAHNWKHRVKHTRSLILSPDGSNFASIHQKNIRLWETRKGEQLHLLNGHKGVVYSLTFSHDGRLLASGDENGEIRIWDIKSGRNIHKILGGHKYGAISLEFSPNDNVLASSDYHPEMPQPAESGEIVRENESYLVKLWDVSTGKLIRSFYYDDKDAAKKILPVSPEFVKQYDVIYPDPNAGLYKIGKTRFSAQNRGIEFKDSLGNKAVSLMALDENNWVAVMPDGRFDTNQSLDNIQGLHWALPNEPLKALPLEIFMRQYYEPGLLKRFLKCNEEENCDQEFKPVPSISELNRVQPRVSEPKVSAIKPDGTVDVTVEVANVSQKIKRNGKEETLSSGIYDLRLFRDGQFIGISTPKGKLEQFIAAAPRLVAETNGSGKLIDTPEDQAWREANDIFKLKSDNIKVLSDGKIQFTFRNIKLPKDGRKEVEFTAYAFNSDRVKSNTAQSKFNVSEAVANTPRKGKAVVVSIGVNASEIQKFNLRYAANDAKKMQEIVSARLRADAGKYSEVISIPLISDYDADKKVTDNTARKAVIKGVFSLLAGNEKEIPAEILAQIPNRDKIKEIQPEDTLIITYAGHGYADRHGIFYLLPFDVGANSEDLSAVLSKSISSDELSLWMLDITAQEMIFIVDACNSAAAVQGSGFKPGPMGSRGLGQLAYDKGMRILAATQADNVALELNKLQQGLLSYALLQNGIVEKKADTEAAFNQLSAGEWLSYGVKRVPEIYEEVRAGKRTLLVDGNTTNTEQSRLLLQQQSKQKSAVNLQQPTLFDFSRSKDNRSLLLLP